MTYLGWAPGETVPPELVWSYEVKNGWGRDSVYSGLLS